MRIPSSQSLDQQQQTPPWDLGQQQQQGYYNTAYSGHGSIRPLIGVLVVIVILGAVAVMIGRLCSGRGIMGHGRFDFESWVEKKCSSFIDGRMDSPQSQQQQQGRRVVEQSGNGGGSLVDAAPVVVAVVVEESAAGSDMQQEEEATDIAQNPPRF